MAQRRNARRPRWFVITVLLILGYFGSMIVSQGLYLSHVHEDQVLATERLTAAQAENDRLRAEMRKAMQDFPIIGIGTKKRLAQRWCEAPFPIRTS